MPRCRLVFLIIIYVHSRFQGLVDITHIGLDAKQKFVQLTEPFECHQEYQR